MDADAEAVKGFDEAVVLALGGREVDASNETVGGVIECPAKGGTRPLDEDVAEGRRGAARSDTELGGNHPWRLGGDHPRRIRREAGLLGSTDARYPAAMSGYAASARIRGATPRLVHAGRGNTNDGGWWGLRPATPTIVLLDPDDILPEPAPTIAERWETIRERWSQLTFYLFDPDSWR
jgi:hypothetical protein